MQNSIDLERYGDLGVAYGRHSQEAGIISIAKSNTPLDAHRSRIDFFRKFVSPKEIGKLTRFDKPIIEPIITKVHRSAPIYAGTDYFLLVYGVATDRIRNEAIPVGVATMKGFVRDNSDTLYFNNGHLYLAVMFNDTEVDRDYLPSISKKINDLLGTVIRNIGTEVHADAAKHVPVKPSEVLGLEARL